MSVTVRDTYSKSIITMYMYIHSKLRRAFDSMYMIQGLAYLPIAMYGMYPSLDN